MFIKFPVGIVCLLVLIASFPSPSHAARECVSVKTGKRTADPVQVFKQKSEMVSEGVTKYIYRYKNLCSKKNALVAMDFGNGRRSQVIKPGQLLTLSCRTDKHTNCPTSEFIARVH